MALAFEEMKGICIRRSKLAEWLTEPFFDKIVEGCFVRVGMARTSSGDAMYRLCRVKNVVVDHGQCYEFGVNRTPTNKWLNCDEEEAGWVQMANVSDSLPLEEEFRDWAREVRWAGGRSMPSLEEVKEKQESIKKVNVYSAHSLMRRRQLRLGVEQGRARKELAVARRHGDAAEMERARARLRELEGIIASHFSTKQKDERIAKLTETNKSGGQSRGSLRCCIRDQLDIKAAAGDAADPFARRWTRPTR